MNGIAHIQLNVRDYAACRAFYSRLFDKLEMQLLFDSDELIYGVGSRTGILVAPATAAFASAPFEQGRAGLHHFCFRARTREDIDELHRFLVGIGAYIVHQPEEAPWAPGYYSVLFADPDGISIEANFVPGKSVRSE